MSSVKRFLLSLRAFYSSLKTKPQKDVFNDRGSEQPFPSPIYELEAMDMECPCSSNLFSHDRRTWIAKSAAHFLVAEAINDGYSNVIGLDLRDIMHCFESTWIESRSPSCRANTSQEGIGNPLLNHIADRISREKSSKGVFDEIRPFIGPSIERARQGKIPELDAMPSQRNPASNTTSSIECNRIPGNIPGLLHRSSTTSVNNSASSGSTQNSALLLPSTTQIEMHWYTSRLYEHGSKVGKAPQYTKTPVSSSPPVWKCSATFGSLIVEASGSTYKEAQHQTSYVICTRLDLVV